MLSHNTNLYKLWKIKSLHSVFPNTGIKLETSNKKMAKETPTAWKLSNTFENSIWVKKKKHFKICWSEQ